ncbi:methyltransferase domain-containing protein [Candidatus Uhrbacteria bacterium]|nr:methyltransferase domain-containing protein [Candidatus Uhrbacteria bacterium]
MSAGSALLNARAILAALDVPRGAHVADVGAGRSGHFVFAAADAVGSDGRVYAIDILPDAVRMVARAAALRGMAHVVPVWGDVERAGGVAVPDASLDIALLIHALGALRQHEDAANEIRRCMKPGGKIVVIDWQPDARHPVATLTDVRPPSHIADALFAHVGCAKYGEFSPSAWHWGRVYAA